MPDVSRAQQRAMGAAAAGHSTLGIPSTVGQEFISADRARGPTKLPERAGKKSPSGPAVAAALRAGNR